MKQRQVLSGHRKVMKSLRIVPLKYIAPFAMLQSISLSDNLFVTVNEILAFNQKPDL